LLCGLLLAVRPAGADTFTFNDTSATLTVTRTGSSDTSVAAVCTGENCMLSVSEPSGVVPASFLRLLPGQPLYIADPNGTTISDELLFGGFSGQVCSTPSTCTFTGYEIDFFSDDSGTGARFGTCASQPTGCLITENGLVQTAETIQLKDSTGTTLATDTIQFASGADATSTPEPSSLALLLTGITALGLVMGLARRKELQELAPSRISIKLFLVGVTCLLASVTSASAGTIDFDNAPMKFWVSGGGQDLGAYYTGVTFGPDAQITTTSASFPSHSGQLELTDSNLADDTLIMTFDSPESDVSFWFTSADGFVAKAFDSSNNFLGFENGGANVDLLHDTGASTFLDVSFGDITSIVITDNGSTGTFLTIDDLTAQGLSDTPAAPTATPEPSSLLLLACGLPVLGMLHYWWRLGPALPS
jgi:hypothetical protein